MKKTLTLLLVATLLLPCVLTSCNLFNKTENTTPAQTTPISSPEATTPTETTPAETTPEQPIIPQEPSMKLTNVKIISNGTDPAEATAAAELKKYLEQRSVTVSDDGFPITLVLDATLGDDSFRITSSIKEDAEEIGMTIACGNGRGVLYGVYNFLQEFAGFRAYTPELEVFIWEDIIIGDGTIL